jgi:hypothetical protein
MYPMHLLHVHLHQVISKLELFVEHHRMQTCSVDDSILVVHVLQIIYKNGTDGELKELLLVCLQMNLLYQKLEHSAERLNDEFYVMGMIHLFLVQIDSQKVGTDGELKEPLHVDQIAA